MQENEKPKSRINENESLVASVQKRVEDLSVNGQIDFPFNYSVGNALRSAWLLIQDTKDMGNRPALEVCTRESVINALFNTVVQGLNPAKKQVYYIVYGNQLQAMRSYFGTMAVLKRLHCVKDVRANVVYKDDDFDAKMAGGEWHIIRHNSSFENIDPEHIIAAYCEITRSDGTVYTEVMNWKQIQTSWSKSKSKSQQVHKEFPDQMAMRTVINRACKIFVNTSDDSDILCQAFNDTGESVENKPEPEGPSANLQALNAKLLGAKKTRPAIDIPKEPKPEPEKAPAEPTKAPETQPEQMELSSKPARPTRLADLALEQEEEAS